MIILLCIYSATANARQHSSKALDSLEYVKERLALITNYVKEAEQYSGVYLDSIMEASTWLGDIIVRNWMNLKTNDSQLLDSILLIKDPSERRNSLLKWKYLSADYELSGLLRYYGAILQSLVNVIQHKQDNILLGNPIDYEETSFVAVNNFRLFREKLQGLIERHKYFTNEIINP
ncbi:MAG: hypothetical protein QM731_05540 [Chitinophagaceae bacterium]